MDTNEIVSTTVKLNKLLYNEFKILGIRHGLSLKEFVERSMHMYASSPYFRNNLNAYILTPLNISCPTTGSSV